MGNSCCKENGTKNTLDLDKDSEVVFQMKDADGEMNITRSNQKISNENNKDYSDFLASYYIGNLGIHCVIGFHGERVLIKLEDRIHMVKLLEQGEVQAINFVTVPHYGVFTDIIFCSTQRCFYLKMSHFEKMTIFKMNSDLKDILIAIDESNLEESNDIQEYGTISISDMENYLFCLKRDKIGIYSTGKYDLKYELKVEANDFKVIGENQVLTLEENHGRIFIFLYLVNLEKKKHSLKRNFEIRNEFRYLSVKPNNESIEKIDKICQKFKFSNFSNFICIAQHKLSTCEIILQLYKVNPSSLNMELVANRIEIEIQAESFRFIVIETVPKTPIVLLSINFKGGTSSLRCFSLIEGELVAVEDYSDLNFKSQISSDIYFWGNEIFFVEGESIHKVTNY